MPTPKSRLSFQNIGQFNVRLFYEKVKEAPPKIKRTWPFCIKRERVHQIFGFDAHANPGLGLQPRSF